MRLLLDSHVALWWLDSNSRLGARCHQAIVEADQVMFSVVTPWELGIKQALGKLSMPSGISAALTDAGFDELAISASHAELAPTLPAHHRDPFDRMLIAQAKLEQLTLATADKAISHYEVSLLNATN